MIDYVIPDNPDDRILTKASQALVAGRLICLPLDTNWVVLASPFVKSGVERLYELRHVDNTKHFTVFCADFNQASEIAYIDDAAFRLIKRALPGPYTFIFRAQKKIIKHLKASKTDHEVGVRFAHSALLKKLLASHGDVTIGTHITADMIPDHDESIPIWSGLIEDYYGHLIETVLDAGETEFHGPTTIISFSEGIPVLVRQGLGPSEVFGL